MPSPEGTSGSPTTSIARKAPSYGRTGTLSALEARHPAYRGLPDAAYRYDSAPPADGAGGDHAIGTTSLYVPEHKSSARDHAPESEVQCRR